MGLQMSQISPRFCVYKWASLIIHWHCFQVSYAKKHFMNSPSSSLINSLRAVSYSFCSMVTETSNCAPSASSLISFVINKACRDVLSVPSVYELHMVSRAEMSSAWTFRTTLPSAMCISLTPAGRTQVLTAVTNWSYVQPRLNSW